MSASQEEKTEQELDAFESQYGLNAFQTDLYDRMGDWVCTCRDIPTAAKLMNTVLTGCIAGWPGVAAESDREKRLMTQLNSYLTDRKQGYLLDLLNGTEEE